MDSPTFLGSNITLVKAHNLRAILLILLHEGHVSRVEIAERTSLSTTTITNLTAELIDQGIVIEEDSPPPPGRRRVGRPRRMLRLDPNAQVAIGVHIGIGIYRVAVTNLFAKIVHNEIAHFDPAKSAEDVVGMIADQIQHVIAVSRIAPERIIGVGVGASGLVDFSTGVNVLAPRLGWRQVAIRDLLCERLGLPVCVDNNVRTMALGEALFGSGRGVYVLAFVYGRIGVGAGFVVQGKVFRTSGAGAGEIGHSVMIPEGGERCTCGNTGCLETLISEPVLIQEALHLAEVHPRSLLARNLQQNHGQNTLECIFAAARENDEHALRMISSKARYLGLALANLVNILNPGLIILGGMFAQGYDLFLPPMEDTLRQNAFGSLGEKVRLKPATFGWRAGVIGAASLALATFFYQHAEGAE